MVVVVILQSLLLVKKVQNCCQPAKIYTYLSTQSVFDLLKFGLAVKPTVGDT